MDDGTMASTDEAMALIRAADADPRGTVLMLLRVLGSGLATATRARDEARAEVERLRAELADHHTASVLPRETALRETAEALGFTHMGAQGFAGMARRRRDAAVAAEREACAVICDAIGDAAETERDACCDDRSRSLHAGRMHGADECARAIRARGAGGGM